MPLRADDPNRLAALPRLGVGILHNPSLPPFLSSHLDRVDYVEIMPDMFWTDIGRGQAHRFREVESSLPFLDWLATQRPIVAHDIGLSIGTADYFDTQYVEQIRSWHCRYPFKWHSDHLSFARVTGASGHDHNAGLAIPIPYDQEVLDLIAQRVGFVQSVVPVPFLLENAVYYVDIPEQELTEQDFLNRLTARTGCGLLLDLHNLYTNARNHGFAAAAFLDRLDLTRVVEMHIAGGNELDGMYTDSHAGPVSHEVWELLDYAVPRAPNLCAITFEFHESYYSLLGLEGVSLQLERARAVWARSH